MSAKPRKVADDGEFLWLISLSDLMILLFILFVVLFSATYKKVKSQDFQRVVAAMNNKKMPETPIDQVHRQLQKWVEDKKLAEQIEVKKSDDGITLEIKDKVFFLSGESDLHDDGLRAMSSLATTLGKVPAPYKLAIEGHTDDIPIHTKEIADNWELSAMRAIAVLHAMNFDKALLERTVVMAYGEMHPLVPHRDASGKPILENQNKNRRVTLRIF